MKEDLDFFRNQMLTKENTSLKQRVETAEDKLNALQKVNEVSFQLILIDSIFAL